MAPVAPDPDPLINFRQLTFSGVFSMPLTFRQLHPGFAAEVSHIDLREARDGEILSSIRSGLDQYAVLVFRDQALTGDDQLGFARRLDGELQTVKYVVRRANRLGDDSLIDISNVDDQGDIMASENRKRLYSLANRLWHTDSSFEEPSGRYSMLYAVVVPPVPADTQYVDTRAAYDGLPDEMRQRLEGLEAHHSIAYSRQTLGFEFSAEEADQLAGVVQPLVRTIPGSGRRSLYIASHIKRIIGWPVPEGRLLVKDLIERATTPESIFTHSWRVGDLVIWDNRATMHRGLAYDDAKYRREMRRVTTLDLPRADNQPALIGSSLSS
jgi:alpha-ketoglutarate-dependent 2,4-dichlorophenoxyacetate dioxygenase